MYCMGVFACMLADAIKALLRSPVVSLKEAKRVLTHRVRRRLDLEVAT